MFNVNVNISVSGITLLLIAVFTIEKIKEFNMFDIIILSTVLVLWLFVFIRQQKEIKKQQEMIEYHRNFMNDISPKLQIIYSQAVLQTKENWELKQQIGSLRNEVEQQKEKYHELDKKLIETKTKLKLSNRN